jgi:hypothetical protein
MDDAQMTRRLSGGAGAGAGRRCRCRSRGNAQAILRLPCRDPRPAPEAPVLLESRVFLGSTSDATSRAVPPAASPHALLRHGDPCEANVRARGRHERSFPQVFERRQRRVDSSRAAAARMRSGPCQGPHMRALTCAREQRRGCRVATVAVNLRLPSRASLRPLVSSVPITPPPSLSHLSPSHAPLAPPRRHTGELCQRFPCVRRRGARRQRVSTSHALRPLAFLGSHSAGRAHPARLSLASRCACSSARRRTPLHGAHRGRQTRALSWSQHPCVRVTPARPLLCSAL